MTDSFDAIFIGSGINSLVGAALLAKAGWKVCVLERNSWFGGNIRTAEITEPGFIHDVYAAWHPLFTGSEAYRILKKDLEARGLEYLNTEYPTATLYPDGSASFLSTSQTANVEEFERLVPGDGPAWAHRVESFLGKADLAFGLLGTELWSWEGVRLVAKWFRRLKVRGSLEFSAEMLSTSRDWLTDTFRSPKIHGLFAPWVLHTGLGPDSAASGFMNELIAVALQLGGMPVPKGGGARLADALVRLVGDSGGTLEADSHVERVEVKNDRAVGVRVRGNVITARRAPFPSLRAGPVATLAWSEPRSCTFVRGSTAFRAPSTKRNAAYCPPTLPWSSGSPQRLTHHAAQKVPGYSGFNSKNSRVGLWVMPPASSTRRTVNGRNHSGNASRTA